MVIFISINFNIPKIRILNIIKININKYNLLNNNIYIKSKLIKM